MYIQKNLSKLNVIEHEFRQAEKVEVLRQKEEEYMRVRDRYCPFAEHGKKFLNGIKTNALFFHDTATCAP